eukprot:jgi/Bigna1/141789/aug1.65_g16497
MVLNGLHLYLTRLGSTFLKIQFKKHTSLVKPVGEMGRGSVASPLLKLGIWIIVPLLISSRVHQNSSRENSMDEPSNAKVTALARMAEWPDPLISKLTGSGGGEGSVEEQASSLEASIKVLTTKVKEDLKVGAQIGAGAGSSGDDEGDPNSDATVQDFFAGECCGGDE